jgi:hypothetical protein
MQCHINLSSTLPAYSFFFKMQNMTTVFALGASVADPVLLGLLDLEQRLIIPESDTFRTLVMITSRIRNKAVAISFNVVNSSSILYCTYSSIMQTQINFIVCLL